MPDRPHSADFNYIFLLGKLEEACRSARPKPDGFKGRLKRTFDTALNRVRGAARRTRGVLTELVEDVRGGEAFKKLAFEAAEVAELERQIIRNIEVFTSDRPSAERPLGHIWPSPIPVERVLERMIATTLGLLSERRSESADGRSHFQACLAMAAREVVAPALAWRVLCDLSLHHEHSQHHLLSAVVARLEDDVLVQRDFTFVDPEERRIHLPSMVLVRAWARLLSGPGCELSHDTVHQVLGRGLAAMVNKPDVVSARTELFPVLTRGFGWGGHGSDRAHAVALAEQHGAGAAFDATRLQLLSAAHSEDVRIFAETVRHNLVEAVAKGRFFTKDETLDVNGLAGRAFWLARACFRRPAAYRFSLLKGEHPDIEPLRDGELPMLGSTAPSLRPGDYDGASTLACDLLERAATHPDAGDEQRLLARRFLAGFATNPRYWRSESVLSRAPGWVDAYASLPGRRRSLVAQMRGRLAWQQAMRNPRRPDKALMDAALRLYDECLDLAGEKFGDLDAEAPLHLFPELAVLIEAASNGRERPRNALAAIDFILSRNFSIYMDIDVERAAILAGFSQAAIYPVARPAAQAAVQPA